MNLQMGNHIFADVEIPVLWGKRAILQDKESRISVISLEGAKAKLEILGNKPAPGVPYEVTGDGFKVLENETELYSFNPDTSTLTGHALNLPELQIESSEIRVGTNFFTGNIVKGHGVGIAVTETGVALGARLPEGLAKLLLRAYDY